MQTNIRYGVDVSSKTYTTNPTVSQVLADQNLRAVLGFGDSVRAVINGVEQPGNAVVPDGATVVIETRANTKAAPDITFTVKYGVDSVTRTTPGVVTVGDIIEDDDLRAHLGYGDNVRALINGVEQPDDAGIPHGAVLVIETAANTKAN